MEPETSGAITVQTKSSQTADDQSETGPGLVDRSSRIAEGSLGSEPTSASPQGSPLLVCMLTFTTSCVAMSQTQLEFTILLLPAKCG